MRKIALLNGVQIAACLIAIMQISPADAQSQRDSTGLRADDLLAVQVYAIGGGNIPFASSGTATGVDMSAGSVSNQSGGAASATPLLGARVHVPMLWRMDGEQRLAFSIFFETGFQSGLSSQSFIQSFQNTSPTAQEFGTNVIREYWQVPFLAGITLPVASRSDRPWALFDVYGGVTLDSWGQILQGAEANAPGQQGFFGQNRQLTIDPTVGLGVRIPVGNLGSDLPLFVGMNAELQFRPGSVASAQSSNFPVTYYGTIQPYANLAVMARIGIAFGSR